MTADVIEDLMRPAAYPEQTRTVSLIQTHISWILLTDRHAYKIKKPVNFGFLDFSTLEKRRFYCHEELRLNRRLCPDLYEAVVELRSTQDGAAFHGDGPLLDYAVRMKRLPPEGMLDRLVEQHAVSNDDMRRIAVSISSFHKAAAPSPPSAGFGSLEQIMFNWNESLEQMRPYEASTLPACERERIAAWVSGYTREHAGLFADRVHGGYIRECNGDIHLENICLHDGNISIFDCIEFNERFRFCDTAADIAFLAMDLDYHCRPDLAQCVISAYCSDSGDHGLPAVLTFYKLYRAFVRGKVESFRLSDTGISEHERLAASSRAVRHFRLVRGYLVRETLKPSLFITCGLMGCGKSALAEQLAFELGIPVHSSDRIRKAMFDAPRVQAEQAEYGTGLYSAEKDRATYYELERLARESLAAGSSVIIDASFRTRSDRARFAALAASAGVEFIVLNVQCDEATQLRRLDERSRAGSSLSDGRQELAAPQRLSFETPADEPGTMVYIESDRPVQLLAEKVYEVLDPCSSV